MPSPYTHYLCGRKMLELPEAELCKALISKHRQIFNLGTQGPDVLFYYRVWPWTNSLGIGGIGERMHNEKVDDLFENILEYTANRTEEEKDILFAYLCGYICHYSLDLCTHPYIFYKTGFIRAGEKETDKYTYYHRTFETAVDVLMLKFILNASPMDLKLHELIRVNKEAARVIGEMYESILHKVYGIKVSAEQVYRAILDMAAVQAVLRDRTGMKKKLLSALETKTGHYPIMASMIYPAAVNDGLDYLNLTHSPWSLPWDSAAVSTLSFVDMFNKAVREAGDLSGCIYRFLTGEANMETALQRLGSRSFSTGVDSSLELEFKYFECVFENNKM